MRILSLAALCTLMLALRAFAADSGGVLTSGSEVRSALPFPADRTTEKAYFVDVPEQARFLSEWVKSIAHK